MGVGRSVAGLLAKHTVDTGESEGGFIMGGKSGQWGIGGPPARPNNTPADLPMP